MGFTCFQGFENKSIHTAATNKVWIAGAFILLADKLNYIHIQFTDDLPVMMILNSLPTVASRFFAGSEIFNWGTAVGASVALAREQAEINAVMNSNITIFFM
jgi:hypothetical protein